MSGSNVNQKEFVNAQLTKGDEYIVYPWNRFEHGL